MASARGDEARRVGPRLPDGLDTLVGEDGGLVSGGQRQRIALARALLSDARFLVLDEPTAHLDSDTAAAVMREIDEAAGERGVVVITHRAEGLERFPTVLRLHEGTLMPSVRSATSSRTCRAISRSSRARTATTLAPAPSGLIRASGRTSSVVSPRAAWLSTGYRSGRYRPKLTS